MSEWTKEPWYVRELGDDCFVTAAKEPPMAYGPEIMGDDYTGYGDHERKKADAHRIVAAVNACAGIPDPQALREERDALAKRVEAPQAMREDLARLMFALRVAIIEGFAPHTHQNLMLAYHAVDKHLPKPPGPPAPPVMPRREFA